MEGVSLKAHEEITAENDLPPAFDTGIICQAKICPSQFIFDLLEAIFNPGPETIKLSDNKLNFSGKVRHDKPGIFGVWVGYRTLGYRDRTQA